MDHLREQFRSIEREAARAGYLYEEPMRPANVFATEDGVIVPVDCIPVRLPPGKRSFFDK